MIMFGQFKSIMKARRSCEMAIRGVGLLMIGAVMALAGAAACGGEDEDAVPDIVVTVRAGGGDILGEIRDSATDLRDDLHELVEDARQGRDVSERAQGLEDRCQDIVERAEDADLDALADALDKACEGLGTAVEEGGEAGLDIAADILDKLGAGD